MPTEFSESARDDVFDNAVQQLIFVTDVAVDRHWAETALGGQAPNAERVGPSAIDDVDGRGDDLARSDGAAAPVRGLDDSQYTL